MKIAAAPLRRLALACSLLSSTTWSVVGYTPDLSMARAILSQSLASPSGKLTLSPEIVVPEPSDATAILLQTSEVQKLSEKLRSSAKANAVFLHGSIGALRTLCAEQEGARGNFPGPVPVIYAWGDVESHAEFGEDVLAEVAGTGCVGVLLPVLDGKEIASAEDVKGDSKLGDNYKVLADAGLCGIPELTIGAETAMDWNEKEMTDAVVALTEICGSEPASVVVTVNPLGEEGELRAAEDAAAQDAADSPDAGMEAAAEERAVILARELLEKTGGMKAAGKMHIDDPNVGGGGGDGGDDAGSEAPTDELKEAEDAAAQDASDSPDAGMEAAAEERAVMMANELAEKKDHAGKIHLDAADDDEKEDEEKKEEAVALPKVHKSLGKRVPILGSIRAVAGGGRMGHEVSSLKQCGFTGAFLRKECVPGLQSSVQDIEVVGNFWAAAIGDLKSVRSKSFGFRAKVALDRDIPMEWFNYQKDVMESGALGTPGGDGGDLNAEGGDYKGF